MGYVSVVLCFFVDLYVFVLVCDILVMFLPHCIVYYGVPGLHCRAPGPRYFLGLLCTL